MSTSDLNCGAKVEKVTSRFSVEDVTKEQKTIQTVVGVMYLVSGDRTMSRHDAPSPTAKAKKQKETPQANL